MINDSRGPWLQTFTGKRFYPLDPQPEDICIEDIAHALALTNRFGGHTTVPYSVAQHCILVSQNVSKKVAIWGLLHDAAEAYVGDVNGTFKTHLDVNPWPYVTGGTYGFDFLEQKIIEAISEKFGLGNIADDWKADNSSLWDEIEKADKLLLATEAGDLLLNGPIYGWTKGMSTLEKEIVAMGWRMAEQCFLERFEYLMKERK